MTSVVPFTSNHSDVSTNEGYQYEFRCLRCGNGFRSRFRHSISGTGGRIAALAGGLMGGEWGGRIEQFGLMAGWNRSSTRGSTNDKHLLEASQDVADEFVQCRGCGQWLCRQVCWNDAAGYCVGCVPRQAPVIPGRCGRCGSYGDGAYCGHCGGPLRATTACGHCGTQLGTGNFCPGCGTPRG
ncbi:hypothetical protein [Actinomycetospora sp. TBRC 11914]|uniref:hypothetical protein n=1 Tax=Actinomycetospora sp. TBRC 11914 TaxID=2729387 RepID=UPI00145E5967|nr:hypothetical protein [Actinomycetospora sp. TBRC 11914]NMO92693.1 hypothetical protein [Actinomycetospora sp. TBRC 11914]